MGPSMKKLLLKLHNFGEFLKEKLVLTRSLIIDYGILYINKLGPRIIKLRSCYELIENTEQSESN